MNGDTPPEDPRDPPPAIALRPDSIVVRRGSRLMRLQRLLLGGGAALLASVVLAWYVSRVPEVPAQRPKVTPLANFRLPPLGPILANSPATTENAAPQHVEPAEVPPEPRALRSEEPISASQPRRALMQTGAAALAETQDDAPVLWRNHQDVAQASVREVEAARSDRGILTPGFDPAHVTQLPLATRILAKGTALGCTLETAIDSQLPGLVTCLIGVAVYGADGRIALLPRGTRLLGEARSEAKTGQSRVFVLWVEARTPDGMLVPLASPGTDALGRAGVPGQVDTHFFDRFGAAMLISVMDAGVQLAATRGTSGSVIVAPQTSEAVLTEVLRSTVAIPPTIRVRPGTQLSVLVARDVDFGAPNDPSLR